MKNHQLIAVFEGLGLSEVAAYQAAGNLVYSGDLDTEAIEEGLADGLGIEVPVMLRSLTALAAIAAANPFTDKERAASQGKVQVSLLREEPTPEQVATVLALESDEDRLRFDGTEFYWLPAGGMSESHLDVACIERTLGMRTTRTQGTLQRMVKKFGA